jgi:CRP-like cAMP-binding protein
MSHVHRNFKINFEECKELLDPYLHFEALEWQVFQSKVEKKTYKAGEIVHFAGDISDKFVIIKKGIMRAYMINDIGRDFTCHFYFNNNSSTLVERFVVDYDSFINQTTSRISIEVIEDSEAYVISYKNMMDIYKKFKYGKSFAKKIAESFASYSHNKYINRIVMDAQERLEEFLERRACLFGKVYQAHIATYLGITPQSFSRLKRGLDIVINEKT